ncbi:Conserved hypothetical protein [Shewanella piezotolerans WP3]|uniref:Uncharacterized protein n=1 Tax=Shewanella piezotolerans (strain WP3 / JCM 13877) TaxID=225849 RepID=B8CU56_SHEPW|nr:hypothetical protein [Shewanella piezotolerans]ACJ30912.1 Conserved hypothetical protein [Shewanella piezotolerans WP3]
MENTPQSDEHKDNDECKQRAVDYKSINHPRHFVATILTFGLWGLVWWWLILRSEGKHKQIFSGFDDAYWSYLIERDQPPAALHKMSFNKNKENAKFDA